MWICKKARISWIQWLKNSSTIEKEREREKSSHCYFVTLQSACSWHRKLQGIIEIYERKKPNGPTRNKWTSERTSEQLTKQIHLKMDSNKNKTKETSLEKLWTNDIHFVDWMESLTELTKEVNKNDKITESVEDDDDDDESRKKMQLLN